MFWRLNTLRLIAVPSEEAKLITKQLKNDGEEK